MASNKGHRRNHHDAPLEHSSTFNGRRFGYTRDSIAPPFHRDGDDEETVQRIGIRRGLQQRRHLDTTTASSLVPDHEVLYIAVVVKNMLLLLYALF